LAHIAEGNRISSLTRTTGHKEDTILEWLKEAAEHVKAIEAVLMADYQITRGQLDGLWAYVGNKGEKRLCRNRRDGPVLALNHDRYEHALRAARASPKLRPTRRSRFFKR